MTRSTLALCGLISLWMGTGTAQAQSRPDTAHVATRTGQILGRTHLADYDAELRGPDGRVDVDAMVARLKELEATTYYWLILHAPTDWDDLQRFLPKAATAGIDVWVYLVPPTESAPRYGETYMEPFRLDYGRWAEEIARLSRRHPNLTAWVIDDFYANRDVFTPARVKDLQARARAINPHLAFFPLMYFNELAGPFVADYREVIDGVVVAYLEDREEIDRAWALFNDADVTSPGEFAYPAQTPSRPGDFVSASQTARVEAAGPYRVRFRERDDFTGPTQGYHIKQLLIDGSVAWESDVAGGSQGWGEVDVEVTGQVRGKAEVELTFRLMDRKGVSNFPVRWRVSDLRAEHLVPVADLGRPDRWSLKRRGEFESGFGGRVKAGHRRFHIPFISMTAGDAGEFRLRHGDPASPERITAQFRLSLDAWREGKCDGVVVYCLDKRPSSRTFDSVKAALDRSRGAVPRAADPARNPRSR